MLSCPAALGRRERLTSSSWAEANGEWVLFGCWEGSDDNITVLDIEERKMVGFDAMPMRNRNCSIRCDIENMKAFTRRTHHIYQIDQIDHLRIDQMDHLEPDLPLGHVVQDPVLVL